MVIKLLENPGSQPDITLRGLRRLIFECFGRFEKAAAIQALETILDQFQHGFPREKAVYVGIYEDLLKSVGVDNELLRTGWEARRNGEPIMTEGISVGNHEGEAQRGYERGLAIRITIIPPELVRYTSRLKILRQLRRIDEVYSVNPEEGSKGG